MSEAIPGVTLNLLATNTSAASLNLRNDTSGAKTKVLALVTAYNDAMSMLNELTNPKSTLETYGATLSGNSTVTNLRSQLRALVTANSVRQSSSLQCGNCRSSPLWVCTSRLRLNTAT